MDITKFDVTIIFTMALALVAMSFVMPALGLTDTDTSADDIPDLNVSNDRFEVAQDRPTFPNTPTEGTLQFDTSRSASFSDNALWLEGSDTSGGTQLTMINTSGEPDITLTEWDSGNEIGQDNVVLNNTTESAVLDSGNYTVAVETTDNHDPPGYFEVSWKLDEQVASDSWVGRLPGVGALFQTADLVASVLSWGITVFIWFSTSLVFGALNLIGIIIDVSIYLISLLAWLISTYGSVVSSAPSWTKVFVAVPGILLTITLAKMVVIIFRSLPTT